MLTSMEAEKERATPLEGWSKKDVEEIQLIDNLPCNEKAELMWKLQKGNPTSTASQDLKIDSAYTYVVRMP